MRRCRISLLLALVFAGCYSMADTPSSKRNDESGSSSSTSDRNSKKEVAAVPFDGKRAMGYLDELCKIGPRISGSDEMKKQQEYLKKHFESLGATVQLQEFKAKQTSRRDQVEMANMIITWHPDRTKRVLIASHYDTRPIADQEEKERNWYKPFLSANDGTAGVAFLMELGHHIKDLKTGVGVDFVLFDGEEYIYDNRREENGGDKYFFGSKHFATTYTKDKPKYKYLAGVVLDMIAGKNARFPVEINSFVNAGNLVNELWGIAQDLNCDAFVYKEGSSVEDDHLALNRARIPTVDIIDFSYKHWHRLTDVPENCSPEPMEQVAKVLLAWLQRN
jgi:glutaminyl-peptide cyclotransferase